MMSPSIKLLDQIARAAYIVREGGVIGYPTETIYGLGCDATNTDAVQRIYRLKGRSYQSPMLVLIKDRDHLSRWVEEIQGYVTGFMDRFWPGPLTLVFHAATDLESPILGESRSLAVRISSDPVCVRLFQAWDGALVSTSANKTGEKTPVSAEDVRTAFGDGVDFVIDDGERTSELPSTIMDVRRDVPVIVREGAIPEADMFNALKGSNG